MRWCWRRGDMAMSFTCRRTRKGCNVTANVAGLQERRLVRQPVLHADSSDLHPGQRRAPVEADADERVVAQRWAGVGAEEEGRLRQSARARFPRRSGTIISNANIRASAIWRRGTFLREQRRRRVTKGAALGQAGSGVYLDFADAIKRLGESVDPRALRQPVRHVREDHGRERVLEADADLPGGALYDGRACGWTTT